MNASGNHTCLAPAEKEIQTYIAIRDNFLAEAEKSLTTKNIDRANAANDFVTTCLRPARAPYEGQSLSEKDAEFERTRCGTVRVRIAALRARLSLKIDHAHAA